MAEPTPEEMQQEEQQLTPEQLEQVEQAEQDGLAVEAIISAILLAWIVSEFTQLPGIGAAVRTPAQIARAIAWLTMRSVTEGSRKEELIYQQIAQAIKPRVLSSVGRLRRQLGDTSGHNDSELVDRVIGPGLRRNRLHESLIAELRKTLSEDASPGRTDMYSRKDDGSGAVGIQSWAKRLAAMISTSILQDARERAARQSGGSRKVWISRADNRVRSTHRILHMESKDALEAFEPVPGVKIMYPGDRSAPSALWANCRCVLLWLP